MKTATLSSFGACRGATAGSQQSRGVTLEVLGPRERPSWEHRRAGEFRRVENREEKVARILKAEHQRGKKCTEKKLQRSSEVLHEYPADISEDSSQR